MKKTCEFKNDSDIFTEPVMFCDDKTFQKDGITYDLSMAIRCDVEAIRRDLICHTLKNKDLNGVEYDLSAIQVLEVCFYGEDFARIHYKIPNFNSHSARTAVGMTYTIEYSDHLKQNYLCPNGYEGRIVW